MIEKIDGNYKNPYAQNINTVKKTAGQEAPPFLLNYDEKGVVWDRNEDDSKKIEVKPKEKVNTSPKTKNQRDSYESSIEKTVKPLEEKAETVDISLLLKNILSRAKDFFRSIYEFIWYGNEKAVENEIDNSALNDGEKKQAVSEEERDILIRKSIANKDMDEMTRLLTDNYSRIPARGTDLLTQYDKHGNIVPVNGAQRNRILTGKDGMKL